MGVGPVGGCPAPACAVGRVSAVVGTVGRFAAIVGVATSGGSCLGTVCADGVKGVEDRLSLRAGSMLSIATPRAVPVAGTAASGGTAGWTGVMLSCLSTSGWTPPAVDAAIVDWTGSGAKLADKAIQRGSTRDGDAVRSVGRGVRREPQVGGLRRVR